MIFNGFKIWLAVLLAAVGGIILIAAHFLTIRRKDVQVPTILFWQEAVQQSKWNVLFGRYRTVLTMLFLLFILFVIVFATTRPVLKPVQKRIVLVDTSLATNLERAKKRASAFINSSARCGLITAGRDCAVLANMQSDKSASLAALNTIQSSQSAYTSIRRAIRLAKNADKEAAVVVLTGQDLSDDANRVKIVSCPAENQNINAEPLNVFVPEQLNMFAELYCKADKRFAYCNDANRADLILEGLDENSFTDWREPEFVEFFSDVLETEGHLKYRRLISVMKNVQDNSSFYFRLPCGLWQIVVVFVLLVLEVWLFKKGVIL